MLGYWDWPDAKDDWEALGSRNWESLSDEERLRRACATVHYAALGEAERATPYIKIGVATMCFCAIDFLAFMHDGKPADKRKVGQAFKKYCDDYMARIDPRYTGDALYDARNTLLHNFA